MGINTAARCTLSIGSSPAATDQTGFESETWTDVGEIEDLGEFGDAFNSVTFESLADGRTRKYKGTADAGDMQLTIGFDASGTGQSALRDALDDTGPDDYSFKVELNDMPSGGTANTIFYFGGKVMQRRIQAGSVNNVVRASVTIAINSAIIEVAAS